MFQPQELQSNEPVMPQASRMFRQRCWLVDCSSIRTPGVLSLTALKSQSASPLHLRNTCLTLPPTCITSEPFSFPSVLGQRKKVG